MPPFSLIHLMLEMESADMSNTQQCLEWYNYRVLEYMATYNRNKVLFIWLLKKQYMKMKLGVSRLEGNDSQSLFLQMPHH